MNRLKITLLSDSSKFIHLAITQTLFILCKHSYLAIILLILELVFLFKNSKNLLIYSFILFSVFIIRFDDFKIINPINNGVIIKVEDKRLLVKNEHLFYLYVDSPNQYEQGMRIEFKPIVLQTDYQNIVNNFDYKTYLLSKNIVAEYFVEEIKVVDKIFVIQSIPEKIKEYFSSKYNPKIANYLNLFVLGDRSSVEDEIYFKTTKLGINHLFAISGMHIGLLVGFLNLLMSRIYLRVRTHRRIIITFLVCYNLITGFSITILRASLLSISVFYLKENSFTKLDILSFILIAFLLYNPYYIFNIGFALSFLISFSIILGKKFWFSEKKSLQVFKIGCLAYLTSLPIILKLSGEIGVFNLFYNVFFVYFVSYLFLPLSFLTVVFPFFGSILEVVIISFENMTLFASEFNIYWSFQFSNEFFIFFYWLAIIFFFFSKTVHKVKITIALMILLVFFNNNFHMLNTYAYVRILDVNQGDAIHLHHGSCDILIDTGNKDDYDTIINYFRKLNINDLDLLILTHYHFDHYGEALDLLKEMEVKELIVNQVNADFIKYNQRVAEEGKILYCGDFKLQVLNAYNGDNENNNSIVLYTNIYGDNWLFTGDIESEIETLLIKKYQLEIDYLKVAHHGSNTSSTNDFLDQINPKIAFISVGKNSYGHPAKEIIDRYYNFGVEIFRTDEQGSITFYYEKISSAKIIETYLFGERKKYRFIN